MTVSIVVPVFNSASSLRLLHEQLTSAMTSNGLIYEIIFVDDGSRDDSWSIVKTLAATDPLVTGIRMARNFGQHNALLCGIRAARHEVVVTMDDDLQNPPGEIVRLLQKLDDGFDVVYGTPRKQQHGLMRGLASAVTKFSLQGMMGSTEARHASAFRAFFTRLRDAFRGFESSFVSVDVLLTWGAGRFGHVEVDHRPRQAGRSGYTVGKLVRHAINMLTGYTTWPLQAASLLGFVFTLFGLGILVYVVARYFQFGGSVPGFPFLAAIIAIFSGVQLFTLGVFGEYLARIHQRTMAKPVYCVVETTTREVAR